MEPSIEKEYRRPGNVELESPLGIGIDLEKKWTGAHEDTPSSSDTSSIAEPQRAKTKTEGTEDEDIESAPVRRVVTAQDWTSPEDKENPMNWSTAKKVYHTIPPALFAFAVTFNSSAYSAAYPEVAKHFHVSNVAALLGVCLYVLGLAFGPIIAAPLSETFGRRMIYRYSLPISALFMLGAGLSKSFASLLVCRFLAGFMGAPVLAVGAGTIADMFTPRLRANATSTFLMAPFLGPALGPFLGGFVAQYKNWRWTQYEGLFIMVGVYVISIPMSETYKKIILQKRAKKLGIDPPKSMLPPGLAGAKFILTVTLARPVTMLVTEPIVGLLSLYNAFTFSILFCFFEAFPLVFNGIYGFNQSQVGLAFLAVGLGVLLAVPTALYFDRTRYVPQHEKALREGRTQVAPEHRLYPAMAGAIGLSIGLFWFAWTSRAAVHWAVPMVATVFFAWGNLLIFITAALYLVDCYGPLNGASAMAANGLLRYGMSSVFPLFTVQMYTKMTIPWATSFLGFVSLLMLPIPFILFKYGPKIRAKSNYDTIKA